MTEPPEPPRRLEWPGLPSALGDEPEEVLDPGGNWLPEGSGAANTDDSAAKQSIFFRDDRRWAPQHGVAGRSDSALPGPFMFPEPPATEAAAEPVLETGAVAGARSYSRENHFVRELVETLLLAILVFLAVRASIQHYRVEGHSMDPTLDDGEFLLVNSLVYSEVNIHSIARWVPFWDPGGPDVRHVFHGPQRGDIVILHPQQRDDRDLVKRIIGVPGDQFEIRDGTVYINGRPLIEPYIKEPWHGDYKAVVIPAHEFFVMGDNRNGSLDSRAFGLVNEDDIIGKAMASWWPKKDWGLAPNEAPTFGPAN
jgi:signal peptidase I